MIYILAWLICGVCSFYLLKSFLCRITEEQGGLFHCIQELFEQMDKEEIEKDGLADETWKLADENTMLAVVHTLFLVMSLIIWPMILAALLYWMYTGATWEELIYEKENVNE